MVTGFLNDGDGGIRTLVPRRANAFRVRPVMTASIRLRLPSLLYWLKISKSIIRMCDCKQNLFRI